MDVKKHIIQGSHIWTKCVQHKTCFIFLQAVVQIIFCSDKYLVSYGQGMFRNACKSSCKGGR
jgi:hypothetical protein